MEDAGWTSRLLNIWEIEGYQPSNQLTEEAGWTSRLLNIWEIRVAVLSSFIAHVVLILLAGIRRRRSSGVMMLFLWVAYQLSSWVAPYALTNLSICGDTSRRQQLVAFWATFLLHHLGGPDNISAFSLEDNALSGREALNVVSRLAGASYVLYKHVYLGGSGGALVQASIVIFFIGAVKYAERAWALWRGDLGNIRGPRKEQPTNSSRFSTATCCSCLCSCSGSLIVMGRDNHLDDEAALILAHDMLPICRRAIADSSPLEVHDYHDLGKSREIFPLKLDNMCKVVEMELSLIYDILYTKAAVVHTSLGYIVRVTSPLAIIAATVLFGYYSKEGQSTADVTITYALLSATFLLDMTWLLRALGSTWTHAFLQSTTWLRITVVCTGRWWHRLRSVIVYLDLGRLLRLGARPPASESSYRMWPGTIGQYNLLHECTRKIGAWGRLAKKIGLEHVWNEYYYCHSRGYKLSPDVKALLFERVRKILVSTYQNDKDGRYSMQDITTFWGQLTTKRRQENLKEITPAFGGEFQEDILVWHIATQIFLSCGGSVQSLVIHDKNAALHAKAIKALSEYLMFLATVRRHMLPGLVLRGLYGVTLEFLQEIWDKHSNTSFSSSPSASAMTTVEDKLARILLDNKNEDEEWGFQHNKSSLVSDAAGIALELLSANQSKMPELLELVFKIWVDKLMYAATRCSPESHAKQLSRGGDLTTIIWIMAQHAGSFKVRRLGDELFVAFASAGSDTNSAEGRTLVTSALGADLNQHDNPSERSVKRDSKMGSGGSCRRDRSSTLGHVVHPYAASHSRSPTRSSPEDQPEYDPWPLRPVSLASSEGTDDSHYGAFSPPQMIGDYYVASYAGFGSNGRRGKEEDQGEVQPGTNAGEDMAISMQDCHRGEHGSNMDLDEEAMAPASKAPQAP